MYSIFSKEIEKAYHWHHYLHNRSSSILQSISTLISYEFSIWIPYNRNSVGIINHACGILSNKCWLSLGHYND